MKMLGRYAPQQAVHSHLPMPPSAPNAIPIHEIPSDRPFPTSNTVYTSPLHPEHAIYTAGHASTGVQARVIQNGYTLELRSYQLSSSPSTSSHEPTTLRVTFPEVLAPLSGTCITTAFSAYGRSFLYVMLMSTSYQLYRLRFSRAASYAVEGGAAQTFSLDDGWFEEVELPLDKVQSAAGVGAHSVVTEDLVLIGCGDGGVLKAERLDAARGTDGSWAFSKLSTPFAFKLPRLTSYLRDGGHPSQVVTICSPTEGDAPTKVFTLSRDRTLRCWDHKSNSHKASVSLPLAHTTGRELALPESPASPEERGRGDGYIAQTDVQLLQIIPNPVETSKFGYFLVAFIPTPRAPSAAGYFRIFGIVRDDARGSELQHDLGGMPCSATTRGAEIRGFGVTPPPGDESMGSGWKLWAAFDLHGQLLTQVASLDQQCRYQGYDDANATDIITQTLEGWSALSTPAVDADAKLDAAHFDALVQLVPAEDQDPLDFSDIQLLFTSHLFQPRRFSVLTLSTAISEYIGSLPSRSASQAVQSLYPTLHAKYAAVVGCSLSVEYSQQTGAPMVEAHRRALKREWLGVWARAREIDKEARWPVAVIPSPCGSGVIIGLREGLVAPMTEDIAGVLNRLGSDAHATERNAVWAMPPGPLSSSYPALAAPESRRSILAVARAGAALSDLLATNSSEDDRDALSAFEAELNTVTSAGPVEAAETNGARLWEDLVDSYVSDEVRAILHTTIGSVSVNSLEQGLVMLAAADAATQDQELSPSTSLGRNLVASAIAETALARSTLARNFILAILFRLEEDERPGQEDEGSDELVEMLSRAFVIYHRFQVFVWLSNQKVDDRKGSVVSRIQDGDEALLESLTGLKMGDLQIVEDGADFGSSALRPLLDRWFVAPLNSGTTESPVQDVLAGAVSTFIATSGLLAGSLLESLATSSDVVFAHALLLEGQAALAKNLVAMYPPDTGMAFVGAKASLEMEAIDDAIRGFESVAPATSIPNWAASDETGLSQIIPETASANGLFGYFRHVSALFDAAHAEDAKIRFAKLAIEVAPDAETSLPLWSRVFLGHVALGQFEEAYSALTAMPSRQQKLDCLPTLISTMCESNEVGRLTQFGFVGFQDEVEKTLRFKARNSDPLRFPNYYKVLYSWHIFRGDYRSAGSTMYDQARSLGHNLDKPGQYASVAAMQARSYLSAINALSLVEKRNAWVAVPKIGTEGDRIPKRQKLSHFIPEDEFATKVKPVDIMTVTDIKQEYALVLATLELARQFPEVIEHNLRPSPTEVVGLFTQASKFDMAQAAAKSLKVDMTNMFQSLTLRCIELSRLGDVAADNDAIAFLQTSPSTSHLRGSPAALALRYLQLALSRHDSAATHYRYRQAVADKMFESGSGGGWEIPQWLITWEMERAPEEWIARALRWGWVEEAASWSLDVVRKATPPELLPVSSGMKAFLPYNVFDRVLAASTSAGVAVSGGDAASLKRELQTRVHRLQMSR